MKLAALYTVFNGIELLDKSIEQIYNDIDVLIICVQSISNTGNKTNQSALPPILTKYFDKLKLIDFTPDFSVNTKENERRKHNLMLTKAKKLNCSHFLLMACDHYYKPNKFKDYKNKSIKNDYDITFTEMNTYYKKPTLQVWPRENYYMPFITKIYPETKIIFNRNYPVKADPSVMVNTTKSYKIWEPNEILLHHYTAIRININDKYRNAAASIRWEKSDVEQFKREYENAKPGDVLKYFQGRQLKKVENIFNI